MTDIGNWRDLIREDTVQWNEFHRASYIMLPVNAYQMGNLVDALSQVQKNGDWWGEWLDIIAATMKKLGINELRSNRGIKYTYEDVATRLGTIKRLRFEKE